jgi:AcrR family transcriptional regulator
MGIKERQEREREARARSILDATRQMFIAEGYLHVSIRKVAERLEMSPATIYGYFESKDAIFLALAEEGFHLFFDAIQGCDSTDPLDRVRHVYWQFYQFSKSHPEYYALMFLDRSVPRIHRDWPRFAFVQEMRQRLRQRIQACIDAGAFPAGTRPDAVARILFAAVHGPAVLNICDRHHPHEDLDALARDVLEATLRGLQNGAPLTFQPVAPGCPATTEVRPS